MTNETLEQKARDYAERSIGVYNGFSYSKEGYKAGYEQGVKDANKWTPVSESLPDYDRTFLIVSGNSGIESIKVDIERKGTMYDIGYFFSDLGHASNATHWRYMDGPEEGQLSTKYKTGKEVPSNVLCARLKELSKAVSNGRESIAREFYMRVPAEHDNDADLVLHEAADRIEVLENKIQRILNTDDTGDYYERLEEILDICTNTIYND